MLLRDRDPAREVRRRVRRALEDPNEKGGEFVDAAGKVTKTAALDSTGVTGVYTSSEGLSGSKVWGTRGKWTTLGGTVDGRPVTIAILDHPGNPGFPTYWHARAYGLFAFDCIGGKMKNSVGYGQGDSAYYVGDTPPQTNPKWTLLTNLDGHENVLGY